MNSLFTDAKAIRREATAMMERPKVAAFETLVAIAKRDAAGSTEEDDAQLLADAMAMIDLPDECYQSLVRAFAATLEDPTPATHKAAQ